jgi:hypothetical protein
LSDTEAVQLELLTESRRDCVGSVLDSCLPNSDGDWLELLPDAEPTCHSS